MTEIPQPTESLPVPLARRVDQVCNDFESASKTGRRPRPEDLHEGWQGAERLALLRELIRLEIYYRKAAGEDCGPEEYLARFPDLDPEWLTAALSRSDACSSIRTVTTIGRDSQLEIPARVPVVPGFEVLRELGRGGMGIVYQAWQGGLNRLVAIKTVLPGAGPAERARFKIEAEAAARLRHPHIVPIYEVGEWDGHPFYVMEYVDGGSLAQKLGGTPLAGDRAAALLEVLARAVHHAHRQGVVHRDLNPNNVLLMPSDPVQGLRLGGADAGYFQPKIADFGVAKILAGGAGQTLSGAVLGTPSYMAPEQAGGHSREVGPPADVYALGALLYECLTGRPPFKAETTLETLALVVCQEPVPPRRVRPNLPRDLETICLKCLQKEPQKRYASAETLADDLRRFRDNEPIVARPLSAAGRVVRWVRRRPALAALVLVSAVAALALVGIVVGLIYNRELRLARRAEEQERQRAEHALHRVNDALEKSETYLYFYQIGLAQREWWGGNVASARSLLAECPQRRRFWEWHYLNRLCHSELLILRGHKGPVYSVAYTLNGNYLASGGRDGTVKLWDAGSSREVALLRGHKAPVWSLAFSSDDALLASVSGFASEPGQVIVWRLNYSKEPGSEVSATELLRVSALTGERSSVAFSTDGRALAVASGLVIAPEKLGRLKVLEVESGKEFLALKAEQWVRSVAFSPDGRFLAAGTGGSNLSSDRPAGIVKVWQAGSGTEVATLSGHTDAVVAVAFSPDGRRLASGGLDKLVKLWTVDMWHEARTLRGHVAAVNALTFRSDSGRLTTVGDGGAVKIWDVVSAEELHALRGHESDVYGVAYHPDGQHLATGGEDQIRVWDATSSQEARSLRHAATVPSVAFSPDGRWMASASHDRTVRLWDLRWPGEARTLVHGQPVWSVAFSPDSTTLACGTGDWRNAPQAGEVKVWEVAGGRERFSLRAHAGVVWSVAFSPDGRELATAGGELKTARGEVKLWDARTGTEFRTLPQQPNGVRQVVFSPDGRRLGAVITHAHTVKIWDATTGQELLSLPYPTSVWCIAFSADGKWVAAGGSDITGAIRVWDSTTGELRATLRGHTEVLSLAFSPDGQRLASAGYDQTVKLWDLENGREVLTLKGHTGPVWSVAFSPDARRLASSGDDRTVKLWERGP